MSPSALAALLPLLSGQTPYECTPSAVSEFPATTQAWQTRCIPFYVNAEAGTISLEESQAVVESAFATWSETVHDCTDLAFTNAGRTEQLHGFNEEDPEVNKNVIASLVSDAEIQQLIDDGKWLTEGMIAITITTHLRQTGEILDADILLNDVDFEFVNVENVMACLDDAIEVQDLENTLTHEVGHFVGFGHTGRTGSTMFASAIACETGKRDLAAGDIEGLCDVYPAELPSATCSPPPDNDYEPSGLDPTPFRYYCDGEPRPPGGGRGGGCECGTSSGHTPQPGAIAGLLVFALLGLRRRPQR